MASSSARTQCCRRLIDGVELGQDTMQFLNGLMFLLEGTGRAAQDVLV